MAEVLKPRLWSDFDGTAVELAKKANPRNWSKYPLREMSGYLDFLRGATDTGLIDFAGFVSRRPNIAPRRMATMRSISKLGIDAYMCGDQTVELTGSETAKGAFLVKESHERVTGMVEDKPHKLGPAILGALRKSAEEIGVRHEPIVLGVVSHPKSQEYTERLLDDLVASDRRCGITHRSEGWHQIYPTLSYSPRIDIVALGSYSEQAGRDFAKLLSETA